MAQKVLLIAPPFSQINTPYPATAYLKGFLNERHILSAQCDLGIETILELFSRGGLKSLFAEIDARGPQLSDNGLRMLNLRDSYISTIDSVIAFLQGKNPPMAYLIADDGYLPRSSRLAKPADMEWAFGNMGIGDKARHLATLYLEDLSDLVTEAVDSRFGFSRYAEQLGRSAATFDTLDAALNTPNGFIDSIFLKLLAQKIENESPTLVAFSVPFPGNLYGAFKCAQYVKTFFPEIKTLMGGGFPNTELRLLTDRKVMDYFDFITLDDGEAPLLSVVEYLDGKREAVGLKRAFVVVNNELVYIDNPEQRDFSPFETGTPDYSGLKLDNYLSVIEIANPMHRLWGDGRWNKLTLAHGCYWGRCTFCDTSLDYISRYEPNTASEICDRMEIIISRTGQTGFHFVDEAAPPSLMRDLALEIIRRRLGVVWWTNIRFEKSFTRDLCFLLKESGCIAVSGGLEVASNRLLKLINKGVDVAQVAKVADNFARAGIMVHAYLMYGFPTQTEQETIDSLEVVRQLFEAGAVQSGFWHRFALTVHSEVSRAAEKFGIRIENMIPAPFANNDLIFNDLTRINHEKFGEGLRNSLFNYMHGICFDLPLQSWFNFKVPGTTLPPRYIQDIIDSQDIETTSSGKKIVWIGGVASIRVFVRKKKKVDFEMAELVFSNKKHDIVIQLKQKEGEWLFGQISTLMSGSLPQASLGELEKSFEMQTGGDFVLFWNSPPIKKLRENGLLTL